MKKTEKRSELQKNINYKNLIDQYYDKDPQLADNYETLKPIFPEIQILQTLNQFEKKIDSLIKTKRYDVQEMFIKPAQKLKRILRVYLVYQTGDSNDQLQVFGNLHPAQTKNETFVGVPKLTSFFKQISFYFPGDSQPFQSWKKPTASNFVQQDGFKISLPKSSQDSSLSIKFNLISNPPKFQIQSSLQRIVSMKKGTRMAILDAFWQYVKDNKLQDIENKQIINCDEKLKNTFKIQKFAFATVNNRIRQLLTPLEPITVTIRPSEGKKVFDFIVEVQERPDVDIVPFFAQKLNEQKTDHPYLSLNGKIKKYQKKIQEDADKLRRHLAKKQIYQNFRPESIQSIINEQNQLLKIIRRQKPVEEQEKLEFILQNEEEVQKQIKHYYDQLNSGNPFTSN